MRSALVGNSASWLIYEAMEENLACCPDGFEPVAMALCQKMWKDHKAKTKSKWFVKQQSNPNIFTEHPKRVLPDQWKELVTYWLSKDAKDISLQNSINREYRGPSHKTGRTHFANIRQQLRSKGEEDDKMTVYLKTRDANDVDVKQIQEENNQRLVEVPEPLRTRDFRDKIFHDIFKPDGHGYCRTYGGGVLRSMVYGKKGGLSQISSSSTIDEITQQVKEKLTEEIEQRLTVEIERRLTGEIEHKLTEKFTSQFEQMRARMDSFFAYGDIDGSRQAVPDASSGYRVVMESVGDDIDEQIGFPLAPSPRSEQVGPKVRLLSFTIPKQIVAEGIRVSMEPSSTVDKVPLGPEFYKVFVESVRKPNALLERPSYGVTTVGEVVNRHVAWRSCDVLEQI